MIPGVGFFYSGLLRRKNALSMIYLSMMTLAVVSFQVSAIVFVSRSLLPPPSPTPLSLHDSRGTVGADPLGIDNLRFSW
jgi:hypothetical protein